MTARRFHHLPLAISVCIFVCCNNNPRLQPASRTVNSNEGVPVDTLDLIYNGPKGFTLEYFPRQAIHLAGIKACEITEQDETSHRIAKKVQFDNNGNIIKDINNFFSFWFEGTMTGKNEYEYDTAHRNVKIKGIPEENSKDSTAFVLNYNSHGHLHSTVSYRFAKRLKPGADRHLAAPEDYEKYPTWNEEETCLFLVTLHTVTIETLFEGKSADKEKYQLLFDGLKSLKSVHKFRNGVLQETTNYTYEQNSITGFLDRTMNDGTKFTYKSKAILNKKGAQIEKIVLHDDGTADARMVVDYNDNGTVSRIKYGKTVQEFKYYYFGK